MVLHLRRFDLSTRALYPICFSAVARSRKARGSFRHLVTSLIGEISFNISIGAEVSEERLARRQRVDSGKLLQHFNDLGIAGHFADDLREFFRH